MEVSDETIDSDNHNTNQNEAICQDIQTLRNNEDQIDQSGLCNKAEEPVKEIKEEEFDVPSIVVTPASPQKVETVSNEFNESKVNVSDSGVIEDESKQIASEDIDIEPKHETNNKLLLQTPPSDKSLKAIRPPDIITEESCINKSTEEEIKVICRYSSTPKSSSFHPRLAIDCSSGNLALGDASPISSTTVTNEESLDTSRPENDTQLNDADASSEQPSSFAVRDENFQSVDKVTTDRNPTYFNQMPNYPYFPPPNSNYTDYNVGAQGSWTDLGYHPDAGHSGGPSVSSPCCYNPGESLQADNQCFVYPSIYVSSAGLISVLLRNDICVEMTVDRTIRVVSHNHMMAVATDSKGTSACLYHPVIKVFQTGSTTDIATDNYRARLTGETAMFSNGSAFFKLFKTELQPTGPIKFSDIVRDQSVNLLFSSEGYGESLVASCMSVAAQAEYANLPKGGVIVRINGVKVTQTGQGDVTVVTGTKFVRLSPVYGTTRLGNRFVDIEVEKDWSVKLTQGIHTFTYNKKCSMIWNGKMEAGFDEYNVLKVPPVHPLFPIPNMPRRLTRRIIRPQLGPMPPNRRMGPGGCEYYRGGGPGPIGGPMF